MDKKKLMIDYNKANQGIEILFHSFIKLNLKMVKKSFYKWHYFSTFQKTI